MSLVTYWNTCSERGSRAFWGRHTLTHLCWDHKTPEPLETQGGALGEGTCVHEPFWIDNATLLEAGYVRKAGFWDMLLTEVTGTEQGAGFAGVELRGQLSREQALEILLCQGSISADTQSTDSFLLTIISFKYCLECLELQGSLKTLQLCTAYSDWLVWCPPGLLSAFLGWWHVPWECSVLLYSGVMVTKGLWVSDTIFNTAEESIWIFSDPGQNFPGWYWRNQSRAQFLFLYAPAFP